ncbi:hypothetical protein cand_025730 [Cryptosporidium andersoni]|uniref:Uncharacterized protein n=1 Tax=Cryptosporidium andersoni TaxID=117008 RepID=A0A1J4ME62_9CRYT|nr:hypothetical protein cand_025730 [Cryptosporidium andersoni]
MSIYMEDNRDEEGFNQMGLLNKLLEYPQDTLEKSDNNIENQLTCDVRVIMQAYWGTSNIHISNDTVTTMTKLTCSYIDKLMTAAAHIPISETDDNFINVKNILTILEGDERKFKRAQDVIRVYREQESLQQAYDDSKYIGISPRNTDKDT